MREQDDLLPLIGLSIRAPKDGARAVLGLGLRRGTIWLALATVVVLGTVLGQVHDMLTPTARGPDGTPIALPGPFVSVFITATLLVALDFVTARIGLRFGGTGGFFDILLVDIWLRVIALFAMALDVVAYMVSPGLGQLVLFATYLYLFWMMLNFVSVAHGGLSLGKTLLVIVLSALITLIPFLLMLSALGLTPMIGAA